MATPPPVDDTDICGLYARHELSVDRFDGLELQLWVVPLTVADKAWIGFEAPAAFQTAVTRVPSDDAAICGIVLESMVPDESVVTLPHVAALPEMVADALLIELPPATQIAVAEVPSADTATCGIVPLVCELSVDTLTALDHDDVALAGSATATAIVHNNVTVMTDVNTREQVLTTPQKYLANCHRTAPEMGIEPFGWRECSAYRIDEDFKTSCAHLGISLDLRPRLGGVGTRFHNTQLHNHERSVKHQPN